MDAVSDPLVEIVAVMSSSQIGKTEILLNVIGYFVDQDPSPMMLVQPTIEMGEAFSKDRLATMIRDTPCLQGKVRDSKSRNSNNTILHKTFPGGHLTISGANSPASLASRPIRVSLADEINRYPESAGSEGDPLGLIDKRQTTFWNKKKVRTSTPTVSRIINGIVYLSRIESEYESSDKRKFYVCCPQCGVEDLLYWENVIWPKDEKGNHLPELACYRCPHCKAHLSDGDKLRMVQLGRWKASAPFTGIAGFWINELYSPWSTFATMAKNFLKAQQSKEKLQVFVNTTLGETWEEKGEKLSDNSLFNRREDYSSKKLPEGIVIITAGVDVQKDRLEVQVIGWGIGEEAWSIEYKVIHGNTALPIAKAGSPWADLRSYLLETRYLHASGVTLRIVSTCVDSGDQSKVVYDFVKPLQERRIYATKGSSHRGAPLVGRPTTSNIAQVKLFPIGTDSAKDTVYSRLRLEEIGPGFIHFPNSYDEEYFRQLTAEQLKVVKGVIKWVKLRVRNEALDNFILAFAALQILNCNLEQLADALAKQAERLEEEKKKQKTETPAPPNKGGFTKGGGPSRGGWVNGWKK